MDRVLPGKSLPLALSIPDQIVPPGSQGVINRGNTSPVSDVWSGDFCERTSGTAHQWYCSGFTLIIILMSVKPELMVSGKLQTKTLLAPFGCEEVKVMNREEEDRSAGRLVVTKFPDGM